MKFVYGILHIEETGYWSRGSLPPTTKPQNLTIHLVWDFLKRSHSYFWYFAFEDSLPKTRGRKTKSILPIRCMTDHNNVGGKNESARMSRLLLGQNVNNMLRCCLLVLLLVGQLVYTSWKTGMQCSG